MGLMERDKNNPRTVKGKRKYSGPGRESENEDNSRPGEGGSTANKETTQDVQASCTNGETPSLEFAKELPTLLPCTLPG